MQGNTPTSLHVGTPPRATCAEVAVQSADGCDTFAMGKVYERQGDLTVLWPDVQIAAYVRRLS